MITKIRQLIALAVSTHSEFECFSALTQAEQLAIKHEVIDLIDFPHQLLFHLRMKESTKLFWMEFSKY